MSSHTKNLQIDSQQVEIKFSVERDTYIINHQNFSFCLQEDLNELIWE